MKASNSLCLPTEWTHHSTSSVPSYGVEAVSHRWFCYKIRIISCLGILVIYQLLIPDRGVVQRGQPSQLPMLMVASYRTQVTFNRRLHMAGFLQRVDMKLGLVMYRTSQNRRSKRGVWHVSFPCPVQGFAAYIPVSQTTSFPRRRESSLKKPFQPCQTRLGCR